MTITCANGVLDCPFLLLLLLIPALLAPSNSLSNVATTRSITPSPCPVSPLLGARESNSSKKRTDAPLYPLLPAPSNDDELGGFTAASRAASNTERIFASLSPTYEPSNSGPFTERNGRPHSRATAFATSVLPVPGAEKKKNGKNEKSYNKINNRGKKMNTHGQIIIYQIVDCPQIRLDISMAIPQHP
jgi:hypothetical protein